MDDGCLLVQGVVGTEQILERLKLQLATCPRPIRWAVEVVGTENLKDYDRAEADDPSAAGPKR
jgi:hypothetical protein